MQESPEINVLGFNVLQQQKRELSVNISLVSSANHHAGTYQQLLKYFKQMKSDHIDMDPLHSSPKLRLKKYKEAVYYGEYLQGLREGEGIMLYHNGQKYQGSWKADKRHGFGYELFANGSTYQGNYFQNKMEGQGKYNWPGGQVYQGEFYNNLKHGSGMWIDAEGNSYVGEWSFGAASGFGVYTEENGSRYEGCFQNFAKHGQGSQKFVNRDLYKGEYQNGKFNGYGEYFWSNCSSYKGSFKNGLREGHGMWRKGEKDDKYEGQFKDNKKQGYGIYAWSNGDLYKGQYRSNLRHGNGEMYWSDGTFYKGEWLVDKPNGKGELFDGRRRIVGVFQDGQLVETQTNESQYPKLSQFYIQGLRQNRRRIVQTPIRKISQQIQNYPKTKKLVFSQVDSEEEAREIKMPKINKRLNPLVKDLMPNRNQLQTTGLQMPRFRGQDASQTKKRSLESRASKEKVMHSSFQIHRMHNRRQLTNLPKYKQVQNSKLQTTLDSTSKFLFSREGGIARVRYFSRLQ